MGEFMIKKIAAAASNNPVQFVLAAGLALGVVYLLTRTAIKEVANVAGGIVSGNNAVTQGTSYENTGVLGTVGAVANQASGGFFEGIGTKIADGLEWVFGVPGNPAYKPGDKLQVGAHRLTEGAQATNQLWGAIGGVALRRK
jgi:hypothetical protein